MLSLAYKDLDDIDDVEPVNEKDLACLNALRETLKEFNALDRFGITLLHSHFPINEDEVLLETCDDKNRTLTMSVAPKVVLENQDIKPTAWRLDNQETLIGCYSACVASGGTHKRKHVQASN